MPSSSSLALLARERDLYSAGNTEEFALVPIARPGRRTRNLSVALALAALFSLMGAPAAEAAARLLT